jgi:hypothetical protein
LRVAFFRELQRSDFEIRLDYRYFAHLKAISASEKCLFIAFWMSDYCLKGSRSLRRSRRSSSKMSDCYPEGSKSLRILMVIRPEGGEDHQVFDQCRRSSSNDDP